MSGFVTTLGFAFLAERITINNRHIEIIHHNTFPSLTTLETVSGAEFGVSNTTLAFAISGASMYIFNSLFFSL